MKRILSLGIVALMLALTALTLPQMTGTAEAKLAPVDGGGNGGTGSYCNPYYNWYCPIVVSTPTPKAKSTPKPSTSSKSTNPKDIAPKNTTPKTSKLKEGTIQEQGVCNFSPGQLIEHDSIKMGNTVLGTLYIYYNANGYNCAKVVSSKYTDGVVKNMEVVVNTCKETKPSSKCHDLSTKSKPYFAYDQGNYRHYAGLVGVSAKAHCIEVDGSIVWHGAVFAYHTKGATHCRL